MNVRKIGGVKTTKKKTQKIRPTLKVGKKTSKLKKSAQSKTAKKGKTKNALQSFLATRRKKTDRSDKRKKTSSNYNKTYDYKYNRRNSFAR